MSKRVIDVDETKVIDVEADEAPNAEPAKRSEIVKGLPSWCGGMRYLAARGTIAILVDLPVATLIRGLAPLMGAGWVGPLPAGAIRIELECSPENASALVGIIERGVEEAMRVVIEASG